MTEEDFLKRWSRRKREADAAKSIEPLPAGGEGEPAAPTTAAATPPADTSGPAFDPATLPPLESINALTDITAFLRAGVPVELTRAALRRVWTADPAIRDFVGLAENAWDFTDPNAMPGFGPLESSDEIRRMIAQVVDQIGDAARAQATEVRETSHDSNTLSAAEQKDEDAGESAAASAPPSESGIGESGSQALLQGNRENDAMQRAMTEDEKERKQSFRRSHGGALPR